MASQTIHFSEDFTDGSVGAAVTGAVGFGIQTQQSWRSPANTYYGPSGAAAFDPPPGYGVGANAGLGFGGSFIGTVTGDAGAGVGVLATGNVWVVDMKYISDMAPDDGIPGITEVPQDLAPKWLILLAFGDDGAVSRGSAATSNTDVCFGVSKWCRFQYGARCPAGWPFGLPFDRTK